MNFFQEQEQARRNTKLLVLLFGAAVLLLILTTNLLVAFAYLAMDDQFLANNVKMSSVDIASGLARDESAFIFPRSGEFTFTGPFSFLHYLQWKVFGVISLVVLGGIGMAMLAKHWELHRGGKSIGEKLGGKLINPNTEDLSEKKLRNVVEEMALASGTPVPPIYILEEDGINAFAAGFNPSDAIIGVTRGCIEQLDRRQLQGVIAHEFSHIFNGDMRLNLRLITVLSGILFVGHCGEFLLRSMRYSSGYGRSYTRRRSSDDNKGALFILAVGMGLFVIGLAGTFFGNVIKAAVSRQREFLADASAVQYTRDPESIGGALKVIGGYEAGSAIESPSADEVSHLFFGQAIPKLYSLFATHPPVEERISRIDPSWNGQLTPRKVRSRAQKEPKSAPAQSNQQSNQHSKDAAFSSFSEESFEASDPDATQSFQQPHANASSTSSVTAKSLPDAEFDMSFSDSAEENISIPQSLVDAAHEPFSAQALVLSLLLDQTVAHRTKQLQLVSDLLSPALEANILQLRAPLQEVPQHNRLPLLSLCLPALKLLSKNQYADFKEVTGLLVKSDGKITLFEWCLYRIVTHYLDTHFALVQRPKPSYGKVTNVASEVQTVLSMLAHHGEANEKDTERAFHKGANSISLYNIQPLSTSEFNLKTFNAALVKLASAYPMVKLKCLNAFMKCVEHDKKVTTAEADLLQTISIILECPIPASDFIKGLSIKE